MKLEKNKLNFFELLFPQRNQYKNPIAPKLRILPERKKNAFLVTCSYFGPGVSIVGMDEDTARKPMSDWF